MKRIFTALIFVLLCTAGTAKATCAPTTFGAYTCQSDSYTFATGVTSHAFTATVTTGQAVLVFALDTTSSVTLSASDSGACTGTVVGYGGSITLGALQVLAVSTTATSSGTCTVTISATSSSTIAARVEVWSGWNGAYDTAGNLVSLTSITSGATASCPAVTTTQNGDLVLCAMIDSANNGGTWTPQTPFASVVTSSVTIGVQEDVQATAGAITPQFKYNHTAVLGAVTITLATGAAAPTFSLAGGTYTSGLPQSTTIATTTSSAFLCVTVCTTNGCTPSAPAAATAGTCSAGTQYSTNSQSVTLAVGYSTYSALATESGLNNSSVVTSPQYDIVPTISTLNGITVGTAQGNIKTFNGQYINPFAGYVSSIYGLAVPFTAVPVNNFLDFHGGTNGGTPNSTTLLASVYGATPSFDLTGMGTLPYSNQITGGVLPQPISIGSTVYDASGTLGLHCTTSTANISAIYCGNVRMNISGPGAVMSSGYWLYSDCPSNVAIDCGADGAIAGGTDYNSVHINGGPSGSCPYNGFFEEARGSNSAGCIPYTPGLLYRINFLFSEGESPIASTFTSSSASVSGTNTLAANQAVMLSTSGTFPGGYSTNNTVWTVAYVSGGTFSGTGTCELSGFNGGGSGAQAALTVTSGAAGVVSFNAANIPSTAGWSNAYGSGYTSAPTTATVSNCVTATGSGTVTITSTLATGTPLYVSSTGLSGSAFQLSTVQGGTPITASSAGTGTKTVTVLDELTICTCPSTTPCNNPAFLGSVFAPALTTPTAPTVAWTGVNGEGPNVNGINFWWAGVAVDNTGLFATNSCRL